MLLEIDPQPYRADLDRAEGTCARNRGPGGRPTRPRAGGKNLITRRAMGRKNTTGTTAITGEAVANLDVATGDRDLARPEPGYTKVTARSAAN